MTQTTPTLAVAALKPERSRTFEVGAKWDGVRRASCCSPPQCSAPTRTMPGRRACPATANGARRQAAGRWSRVRRDRPADRASGASIAAYTYLDSEIPNRTRRARSATASATCRCIAGRCGRPTSCRSGSSLAAASRYVGTRYTNVSNTREVDGYAVVDATAAYDLSEQMTVRAQRLQPVRQALSPTRSAAAISFRVRDVRFWRRWRSGVRAGGDARRHSLHARTPIRSPMRREA